MQQFRTSTIDTITEQEAQERYKGKDLSKDKELYDYDFLKVLPDISVTMMGKKNIPQWTLTVTPNSLYLTVSINGENLAKGTYVVDDGTVVHFEAKGAMSNTITLDGATVASAGNGSVAQYDLVIHANYTATATYMGFSSKWEITTQQ